MPAWFTSTSRRHSPERFIRAAAQERCFESGNHAMQSDTASRVAGALRALDASRARGLAWICSRLGEDGRPVGADRLNSWYRLPWALTVAGRRDSAIAVLSWIERTALDPRGDLRPGAPREPFARTIASYPLSQLVIGAWHLEQYATARRVLALLKQEFVDPRTGGVFSERPELRVTGRADLLGTAQLGLAALAAGDGPVADACCRWLLELLEMQPEAPARLYPCRIGNTLLTRSDTSHTAWDVVTDFHRPFQQFYNPGIAAAFLGRYADCRSDAAALAAAKSYLQLNVQGAPLQFDHTVNAQACKFGWGAAVLLDVDPSALLLEHVLRMAAWFVDSQYPDGHWTPSGFLVPRPGDADNMPKTAEHVLHVATLQSALARYAAHRERDNPR
jgi:hypothetical protein